MVFEADLQLSSNNVALGSVRRRPFAISSAVSWDVLHSKAPYVDDVALIG